MQWNEHKFYPLSSYLVSDNLLKRLPFGKDKEQKIEKNDLAVRLWAYGKPGGPDPGKNSNNWIVASHGKYRDARPVGVGIYHRYS